MTPNNLPEEYTIIRAALESVEWLPSVAKALAALDRLAAREGTAATEAGASAQEKESRIKCQDIVYAVCNFLDAALGNSPSRGSGILAEKQEIMVAMTRLFHAKPTPTAPPAAECAAHALLREAQEWMIANHPDTKELRRQFESGELERRLNFIGPEVFDPTRRVRIILQAHAALAVPCQRGEAQSEITRLRDELGESINLQAIAQALADKFEGALKCSNETAKRRGDELRRAVDALRDVGLQLHHQSLRDVERVIVYVELSVRDRVDEIVAAYDAKHPKACNIE